MTDRWTDRQGERQTHIQRWTEKAETERWRQIDRDRQMERKNRQPYRVKDAVRQIGGQAEG